jgi:putative protease
VAGRPFNPELISELDGLANRGYTAGLMDRRPANDYQNYETGHSVGHRSQFVGEVRAVADGWAEIETKNKFSVGDRIEIIHPSGNRIVTLEQMKDKNGAAIDVAAGSPTHVWIPIVGPADGGLLARLL